MTTIVNIYKTPEYDVYIGRAGKGQDGYFGNPIELKNCKSREEGIAKYRVYFYKRIKNDPEFLRRIKELKDKRLGCFCGPDKLCHGMIIIEYLDGKSVADQITEAIINKLGLNKSDNDIELIDFS